MKAVWFNQLDLSSLCRTSRFELAAALSRLGHRLKVVGRFRGAKPRLGGVNPRPLLVRQFLPDPLGGVFFQFQVFLLAASGILRRVDVIFVDRFCVLTMFPFIAISKGGLIRTKFVLDIRSAPVDMAGIRHTLSRWRYNLSIRCARLFYDGITVITDLYREDISRRFRINPAAIGVWCSGARADVFHPRRVDTARCERIKSSLGLGDRFLIMYHGMLSAYRGLQETVKALAIVNAEGRLSAALVLLGNGPAEAEIRSLARKEGVSDSVALVDSVPYEEVPNYLSVADAGILPFPDAEWWNMSSPLKLMEYLAMEKPVILTDIPAHRAVLAGAECAVFIEDHSPVSIADGIRRLAERKDALPFLGKSGRTIVLQKFTWERQAKNLLRYVAALHRREVE